MDEESTSDVMMRRAAPAIWGAAGALIGGPVGAVLGALAPGVVEMFIERLAVGQQKVGLLYEVVEDLTGHKPEDIKTWATGREERLDFVCHVVQAALDAVAERKVRGLASVLAQGLRDDLWLPHGRIIIRALAELEEPDLQVLEAMVMHVPPETKDPMGPGFWSRRQLQIHLPGFAQSITAIAAVLERVGMITQATLMPDDEDEEGPNHAWQVTTFGRACHQHLQALAISAHGPGE